MAAAAADGLAVAGLATAAPPITVNIPGNLSWRNIHASGIE